MSPDITDDSPSETERRAYCLLEVFPRNDRDRVFLVILLHLGVLCGLLLFLPLAYLANVCFYAFADSQLRPNLAAR
jgi:hypothetical protein